MLKHTQPLYGWIFLQSCHVSSHVHIVACDDKENPNSKTNKGSFFSLEREVFAKFLCITSQTKIAKPKW
jgi:hypothetical protein